MAALSSPAPAPAPAAAATFSISLYQYVHHGMSKAGVPPVPLGQADLSAAATTADFIELVVLLARKASAALSGDSAVRPDFDIPAEKIGCGGFIREYPQKNFRMFAFRARKEGLTDATSTQPCIEYFGPGRDIVVVLKPGATPGITYDADKDPTLKNTTIKKPGEPGGPPPMEEPGALSVPPPSMH